MDILIVVSVGDETKSLKLSEFAALHDAKTATNSIVSMQTGKKKWILGRFGNFEESDQDKVEKMCDRQFHRNDVVWVDVNEKYEIGDAKTMCGMLKMCRDQISKMIHDFNNN